MRGARRPPRRRQQTGSRRRAAAAAAACRRCACRGTSSAVRAKSRLPKSSPKIDIAAGGKATTTATFSAPGEYIIRAQVNDRTGDGGGGFQCCWTNAHVKVTVTGGATTK